jgi:BASS family bile acid:Na+ symporter
MIMVIMLGMGAGLTWRDFFRALKRPQGLFVGLVCQFGIMPALAFGLAQLFQLPPAAAIGLIIMGSVPGGTTSNIFTYFSKGNLALSILMTVNSTLFAFVLTPFSLYFYGQFYLSEDFRIPFENITTTLIVLLVPVAIGMSLRKWRANVGATLEMLGGILGILVILLLVVLWVPRNAGLLASTPIAIYFCTIGLGLVGMVLGYAMAKALKQDQRNATTIALETGIQNGPLALAIVLFTFPKEMQDDVVLVPALYSLFIVLTSSAVTVFLRKWNGRLEQKTPELL